MSEDQNSLRMVQIEPHIWQKLEVFFDEVDIPFFINDVVDNAFENFIVTVNRVSQVKIDAYRAFVQEES